MDLAKVQKYLYGQVKLDYIKGMIDGIPQLPTDIAVSNQINTILNGSTNGIIGSIVTFVYKNVSSVDDYNNNFLTIKNNIEYLLGQVYDSLNSTINIINDSVLEKNQVLRDLKLMDQEFSDIESGQLHSDGLKYVISDNFHDTSKIDTLRTTAALNLNAGTVSLDLARASYLGFPHYKNQTSVNFAFTEGYANIIGQYQTPGTKFGDIFTGADTNRWELVATTSSNVTVAGYFSLKLSEIGAAVSINTIKMKLYGTKSAGTATDDLLTFEYLNQDPTNQVWMLIPNGKLTITDPEISIIFPAITTTYIRITWTKYSPDDVTNLAYHFSITELDVGTSLTVYESDLISNSLEIQPYQNEQPTIFVSELETSSYIQPGTSINYYVAIDDTVPGKIVDINSNVVDITSDDAYAFLPNALDQYGNPENYYTFASLLRDNPQLSGAYVYQAWNPTWQQITDRKASVAGIPSQVFFNVSDFNNVNNNLYYTRPVLWGDPNYKGPWPVAGYAGGWATNWTGVGTAPKSGYIFGEDPFSNAGVWWGDTLGFPGWWRPMTPTASGTYLSTPIVSIPDFIIPVYDQYGDSLTYYNSYTGKEEPIQKQFWKIFKWPSNALPIPGTVKISNSVLHAQNTISNNNNSWTWNYQKSTAVNDYQFNFVVDSSKNFYTIYMDQLLTNTSNISIIQNSIRNVQFTDRSPADITDFTIEYGYEYILDSDGLYHRVTSDPSVADCRATIIFSDSVMTAARSYSSGVLNLSLLLSYQSDSNISASWDSYFSVPTSVIDNLPNCYINCNTGAVEQISVQQVSDTGMITQSNILASGSIGKFNLYTGLNLVRIFVDTIPNQNNIIDGSIAVWNPDDFIFTYPDSTIYMQDTNVNYTQVNSIFSSNSNTNFLTSGLLPGLTVLCTNPLLVNDDGISSSTIIQVNMTILNVTPTLLTLQSSDNKNYYCKSWQINNFTTQTGFTYDSNVSPNSSTQYLTQVDISVLLHETEIEDDTRFAIISDVDNSQYVVVKSPYDAHFPNSIVNSNYYSRTYWDNNLGQYITYTTGTSGNIGNNPMTMGGIPLSNMSPNTFPNVAYPNISTYGQTINVSDPTSSGFLFWDTAENLSTIFTMSYSVPANNRQADRIFFMASLQSNSLSLTPSLYSYSLIINNEIEG